MTKSEADEVVSHFKQLCLNDPCFQAFQAGEDWFDICELADPEFSQRPLERKVELPAWAQLTGDSTEANGPALVSGVIGARKVVAPLVQQQPVKPRTYPNATKTLVCRNLPRDIGREELRTLFERYGTVRDVYIPIDKKTGNIRGFGFIEFTDVATASAAYEANFDKLEIRTKKILVEFKQNT